MTVHAYQPDNNIHCFHVWRLAELKKENYKGRNYGLFYCERCLEFIYKIAYDKDIVRINDD